MQEQALDITMNINLSLNRDYYGGVKNIGGEVII